MNFNLKIVLIILMVLPAFFYQCGNHQLMLNVNIVIDDRYISDSINEEEILGLVTEQFEFAKSYFANEFNIHLNHMHTRFRILTDETIQSNPEIIRPSGTNIAVIFAKPKTDYGGAGRSYLNSGNVLMNVSLDENTQKRITAYKWLLVHEITHLFGTIDLKWDDHLMDEGSLFQDIESEEYTSKTIAGNKTLFVDETTKNIISLVRKQLLLDDRGYLLQDFDDEIADGVIAYTQKLIPKAAFPDKDLFRIAMYYYERNQFKESLDRLDMALQLKPNSIDYYFRRENSIHENKILLNKSRCLEKLKRISEAVKTYEQMDDTGPYIYEKYITLGKLYLNLGQYQKAIDVYRKLTSTITPDNAQTWFVLGVSILETIPFEVWEGEEIEECKQALLKTIELAPAHLEAHAVLGTIYQLQEQPEQAEQHLKRVMELGLDHPLNIAKGGKTFAVMPPKKEE